MPLAAWRAIGAPETTLRGEIVVKHTHLSIHNSCHFVRFAQFVDRSGAA